MPAKHQRLTGKEIQFLLRRGYKTKGSTFVFLSGDQYPNRRFHQRSVQIPVKVDKRSTVRNLLKRHAAAVFEAALGERVISYKKVFMFIAKDAIEGLVKLIATGDKTTIVKQRKEYCLHDFTLLFHRLGTSHEKTSYKAFKKPGSPGSSM